MKPTKYLCLAMTCPYCGFEYKYMVEPSYPPLQIVLCNDAKGGGCDRYFAVKIKVQYNKEYYTLVEGGERQ